MTSHTPYQYTPEEHQDLIWAGIIATVISAQYHILTMAQEASSQSENAYWTDKETDELVQYFYDNREMIGDTGNFKKSVYNAAALHIAEHWKQGGRKTGKMCEGKWTGLKRTFSAIQEYKSHASGVHWDNINGAAIEGTHALSAWNSYISQKGKEKMRPFRNSGWKYYEQMDAIIPGNSRARGRASYQPKKAPPPSTNVNPPDEPTTSIGLLSSIPIISTAPTGSDSGADAEAADATAATNVYAHSTPVSESLSVPLDTSSANGKRSHSNMTHSLPPASTIATSVSARSEALQSQKPPIPVKKAKTTSGRATTSQGANGAKDARVAKATTASAVLGFQSSVNRLTDVISERMISTEDRLIERCSRAMQMLQFEDNDLSFDEQLMIQWVFARDPVSTDIYTQTTNRDLRRAFILSAARRLQVEG